MNNCLIGFTGFVGQTFLKQSGFQFLYRSTNISDIKNKHFDRVVCAGAPAQKWIANRQPEADFEKISHLIEHLKTIECKTFILISTVDVFKNPIGIDEETVVDEVGMQPYGLHRRMLEKFVQDYFSDHLIVRLPGLVGPGLRKNIIFDILNNNNIQAIDSRHIFQFYPMVNLSYDINVAINNDLKLLHLTAEPVSVATICKNGFGKTFDQVLSGAPVTYDMRTRHASIFGAAGQYQYSARDTIQAVRAYAQSEQKTTASENKATA